MSLLPLIWKLKQLLNIGSKKKLKEAIGMRRREMTTTMTSLNKSDLLSRFIESIEDDNVMRDMMEIGREQCRFRTEEIKDHFVPY
ncbi:hypothetical protein Ahy_A01g003712 [Arachis hypogaea]|uniref:Uncharacterized protein n=1 Tax=Arachis hypogaea TaxID=3818 RepID=A0A445ETP1_ARAHY|nr:hypothetical protein Ahy_A01g003712 [Arachis hypogaea]